MLTSKVKAPRNRTLTLTQADRQRYSSQLNTLSHTGSLDEVLDTTIHQDCRNAIAHLPTSSIDLLILDPPYNLRKDFNGKTFSRRSPTDYQSWVETWLEPLVQLLKPTASLYVCADWQSSTVIYPLLTRYFTVRNRITWEREKGRGAKANWKNASEDIWFCTVSEAYTFNVNAVKLKRRVIAPYRDRNGSPKDWQDTCKGRFRLTHPSNLWTDISIPFWSMPENTDHPTQKPEKLVAKLILASSSPGDVVLDPFLGSGTTSVVAKKLNRHYIGIESNEDYCCMAEKRLALADRDQRIQGYHENCFWERNSTPQA
ncbi:DNA methyltransferase [Oscillatoria sp. CS-180]|uniref:DNA-methyltransferase n=1 Tax=Oscillatoria sp. CS-180 TaxID=3021720 RepID=UPI00232F6CD2|nr:DNA methyltransferase [Oscillatoria sp. CS-180]MDB9526688.1 DNA methyltransferase [Oscillatoria sp. CS-180]